MTTYTITSQHGTHCLMLGTMLIAQATDLESLERVKAGFENSNHAQRAEQNTNNNTTRDGIQAR